MVEKDVLGDGHCLLHALSGATGCSEEDVFDHIWNEVQGHQKFYTQFSTGGVIQKAEILKWASSKAYNMETIDMILNMAANAFSITIVVVEMSEGEVTELCLSPRSSSSKREIHLLKEFDHYSYLVSSDNNRTQDIIIIDDSDTESGAYKKEKDQVNQPKIERLQSTSCTCSDGIEDIILMKSEFPQSPASNSCTSSEDLPEMLSSNDIILVSDEDSDEKLMKSESPQSPASISCTSSEDLPDIFGNDDNVHVPVDTSHVNLTKCESPPSQISTSSGDDLPDMLGDVVQASSVNHSIKRKRMTVHMRKKKRTAAERKMTNVIIDSDDDSLLNCYQGNPDLPIVVRSKTGIKTAKAVKILLQSIKDEQICKVVPQGVAHNVGFVFSVKSIGHYKNVLSDGLGAWRHDGRKTFYTDVSDEELTLSQHCPSVILPTTTTIYRTTYANKSSPDLRRTVIYIEATLTGKQYDLVMMQYNFQKEEHAVHVLPHGNTKNDHDNSPYIRTSETTKNRLKELCEDYVKPKKIEHMLIEEKGGLEGVRSGSDIARDRQQIRGYKHRLNASDSLLACVNLAKNQENSSDRFIREVRDAPEFTVFLASNRQLYDVQKMCTNVRNFSILGVDTTFNIGDFFVTLTTYRHLMLLTKMGVEPVMLGPTLLHEHKTFTSYFKLPSTMIQVCIDLTCPIFLPQMTLIGPPNLIFHCSAIKPKEKLVLSNRSLTLEGSGLLGPNDKNQQFFFQIWMSSFSE